MTSLKLTDISQYVEHNIGSFHKKRIQSIEKLKLSTTLKRKNPYLFKAKHILTAHEMIKGIVDAHISSHEETIFGDWLEGLAIFINKQVYGGWKSGISGIDLEFDKDHTRFIIAIKSGPNWGNSSQIKKMIGDFTTAKRTLRTSNSKMHVEAINGCCYGKNKNTDKGQYFKYCGQAFWEFISGDPLLFVKLIEPLSYKAKEKNDVFLNSYSHLLNRFTQEFSENFCEHNGKINWEKLIYLNASSLA